MLSDIKVKLRIKFKINQGSEVEGSWLVWSDDNLIVIGPCPRKCTYCIVVDIDALA